MKRLQKQGTAIGTKMAPPYAILFMDALETKLLNSSELKPRIWWRYLDDIFMIWEHGEEQLRKLLEAINSFRPSTKFTAEWSHESIKVINEGGNFVTDLYVKPTDTHRYLHAS